MHVRIGYYEGSVPWMANGHSMFKLHTIIVTTWVTIGGKHFDDWELTKKAERAWKCTQILIALTLGNQLRRRTVTIMVAIVEEASMFGAENRKVHVE